VSATDDSFNDSASGFQRFEPGDSIVTSGFTEAGNNGTFTVVTATTAKITVAEALTTEIAGAGHSVNINWLTDAYDSDDAFSIAADPKSQVIIEGEQLQCSGLTVTITNSLLPVEQAMIIGEYSPLDFPNITRQITFRATALISNYDLYRALITNSTTGKRFSASPFTGDVDFRAYSPLTYLSGARQFALNVRTTQGNVSWALQGALPFTAGQPVIITLLGTVQKPVSPPYAEVRFQNTVSAAYAIPTS